MGRSCPTGMKVVFSAVRSVDRGEIEVDSFDVTEEGLKLYRAEEGAESVFEDKVLVGFMPHERLDYIVPDEE
jgi:hypothetical protein